MATRKTTPLLVAHRGYPSRYPENTLLGIQAAVAAGAKWFEFDVQLSKDHIPFLCHDASLKRTAGFDKLIMDLSAVELAKADVGEPARFGSRYAGTHPTPLAELIAWLQTQPGVHAFVEIKQESIDHFDLETVVSAVMQAVKPALSRCVIISFNAESLKLAREIGAEPVGWALEDIGPEAVKTALSFKPEYLFVGDRRFTQAHAAFQGPWRWAVYQTQDPERALRLTEQGAHMVETDAIGDMLPALGLK
ncbi:MAG TPA: glycerophosphodiester phosphodiesterase family protein [Gammaproteobacteria bacterium]|nr:glycerophosphodiester phosphodiesterase family protein [Gammaproteobacteria bacterium]